MKLPPLTLKAIRAWVETLPPDQPVGERKDGQRCLVANYIRAHLTTSHVSVVVADRGIHVATWDSDWHNMERQRRTPSRDLAKLINAFDYLECSRYPLPSDVLPILGGTSS